MKGLSRALVFGCTLISAAALCTGRAAEAETGQTEQNTGILCAHAGGVIEEQTYTNSAEAMENSYKWGFRVIEADVRLTVDKEVVCEHDWEWFGQMTGTPPAERKYEDFMSMKKYGTLTPMDLGMLIEFMIEHTDCVIYLDPKHTDADEARELFEKVVAQVEATGDRTIFDRFWVAVYSRKMHKAVDKVYPFKHYVFVSSNVWDGTVEDMVEICECCAETGIEAIDMWYWQVTDDVIALIKGYGLKAYAFTVDIEKTCAKMFRMGIECVTTNWLRPERSREELQNIKKEP